MASGTRTAFLRSAGLGAAGLALAGGRAGNAFGETRWSPALQAVEVNCGFKARTGGDQAELAYGRAVRDGLHRDVLAAIRRARSQGHVAQLRVAEEVLGRIAARTDPGRVAELWLHVAGNVEGKYRGREYVAEL
jgi:hypothetical protein